MWTWQNFFEEIMASFQLRKLQQFVKNLTSSLINMISQIGLTTTGTLCTQLHAFSWT